MKPPSEFDEWLAVMFAFCVIALLVMFFGTAFLICINLLEP
jgi:hypothetical protein